MQEEQDRLGSLEKLRQSGVDPYPTKGRSVMNFRSVSRLWERNQEKRLSFKPRQGSFPIVF